MSDFRVQVDITDEAGQLRREEQVMDAVTLGRVISLATDDTIPAHDLRRLQYNILATGHVAMVALHRCSFRREGRLRSVLLTPLGHLVDVLTYARLAVDPVYGPHGFSGMMNSVLPTKRIIAHIALHGEAGRILLTETTYKEGWELPDGVVDPDESPHTGSRYELLEEISLDIVFDEPTTTDQILSHLDWDDAIELIYDGGALPDTVARCLAPRDRELRATYWVPHEKLPDRMSELLARRINLLLGGCRGTTENGMWIL